MDIFSRLDNPELPRLSAINLFRIADRSLAPWSEHNYFYCVCNNETAGTICSGTQFVNCFLQNSITKPKCRTVDVVRQGRSVSSNKKELDRVFKLMQTEYKNVDLSTKRFVKVGLA